MGRPHPGLARGNRPVIFRSISKQTHVIPLFVNLKNEIGDTSLPPERPEMLDDDLLKQLHHVLLEVSQYTLFPFSPMTSFVDPRRRRFYDMPKLWARLSCFKRDPKYGPRLPFCYLFQRCHFSLFHSPRLQLLAEGEIG